MSIRIKCDRSSLRAKSSIVASTPNSNSPFSSMETYTHPALHPSTPDRITPKCWRCPLKSILTRRSRRLVGQRHAQIERHVCLGPLGLVASAATCVHGMRTQQRCLPFLALPQCAIRLSSARIGLNRSQCRTGRKQACCWCGRLIDSDRTRTARRADWRRRMGSGNRSQGRVEIIEEMVAVPPCPADDQQTHHEFPCGDYEFCLIDQASDLAGDLARGPMPRLQRSDMGGMRFPVWLETLRFNSSDQIRQGIWVDYG